jgi:hypothetical protein
MINTMNRKRLHVSTHGGARSYMILPLTQLDQVTALLTANGVPFEVGEEVLSVDGKPEVAWIYFEKGGDSAFIQNLLDGIP